MRAVLSTSVRTEVGSNAVKKVRKAGRVPAILYGHGEQNVNLSLCGEELHSVLRHGGKLVDLKGDVTDTALVRGLQWNTYGTDVLHVDLARVSAEERVHVSVPVETRGTAAGAREGGIVEIVVHEVEIECPAGTIPGKDRDSRQRIARGAFAEGWRDPACPRACDCSWIRTSLWSIAWGGVWRKRKKRRLRPKSRNPKSSAARARRRKKRKRSPDAACGGHQRRLARRASTGLGGCVSQARTGSPAERTEG